MMNPSSKWRLAAFDDDLSTDNALLSEEQESAKHNIFTTLERIQDAAAEPLDAKALAGIVESITDKSPEEAFAIAEEYLRNPLHNEISTEPVEPQIENEVSQEQMMAPGGGMQTLDSTVPGSAPAPGQAFSNKNSSAYSDQKWPGMTMLEAIKEEIGLDAQTGVDAETLERYALLTAEEFLDQPINTLEELNDLVPGSAEEIRRQIQIAETRKEMQNEREMAEKDPDEFVDRFAAYPGHHKPGDKKHLKGEGPVNEKANEIYHAIMRDKDIEGEPSEEDKSSAAAIAWSQAKKNKGKKKEKKAFFRGQEAEVLDSYRDMWGQSLVRIRVEGKIIEVSGDSIERKDRESNLNKIETLIDFVENAPKTASSGAHMLARIENLKIAMNEARVLLLDQDLSFNEQKALNSIYTRCAAELEELDQFDNFVTESDLERIEELPQFEIGKEIYTSSFSQHTSDWDSVIESIEPIQDIDKFVREDPILLVSELPETLMSDAGAVRTHAKKRVASATAYVDESIRSEVISKYLSNVEDARRNALYVSKIANKTRVESSKKNFDSTPDEGLYL